MFSLLLKDLISDFYLDSIIHIPLLAIVEISRLKLVSVAEQAGLSFNLSQTPKTGFLLTSLMYEPLHDKTNKMTNAPNKEATAQSERSKGSQGPKLFSYGQRRLWSDWRMPRSLGALSFCWFCLTCTIKFISSQSIRAQHVVVSAIDKFSLLSFVWEIFFSRLYFNLDIFVFVLRKIEKKFHNRYPWWHLKS